jgi:phosphomannomutase
MSEITFGTDGWRAIIAEKFTFSNVQKATYAVGEYIRENYYKESGGQKLPVLVGYDTRFLADRFAYHAARTLISMGIPAIVANRDVPTPAIAWAVTLQPTAGALQFTASHNPPEYCGMKYIPHFAGPATNEITARIAFLLDQVPDDLEIEPVDVPTFDPQPPYLEALKSRVDLELIGKSGLKVVFDANYATSRDYLDKVLIDAGLDVKVMHNWRDPLFGGNMPEPKPEYLTELTALMSQGGHDVGLATDGDADRFGVIDENGNYFSANMLLSLITRHLVKNRGQKGAIVRTVATTHLLNRLAELYSLKVMETPVGFKYIGEHMRAADVLIGGEESGGISVKGHIPEKDGILGNLLLVEMLAYERKPLSAIWEDLQKEAGVRLVYRRADLDLPIRTQQLVMEAMRSDPFAEIGGKRVEKVDRADGLKFYFDDFNWLLVRPSGTEPLMRLYFEGTSADAVDHVALDFKRQVDLILEQLNGNGKRGGVAGKIEHKTPV